MNRVILKPGSVVCNKDSINPMSGTVIDTPTAIHGTIDWVWVRWDNGIEKNQHVADLLLTGKLFVEFNNEIGGE